MKLYRCRECEGEFELEDSGKNRPNQCVDCNSSDIMLLNSGRTEFDPDEQYDIDETMDKFRDDELEPGSLFDSIEDEEELDF